MANKSDKAKQISGIPTMPSGKFAEGRCPECGFWLVTDGKLVWCMRRDNEIQKCGYVRVK